MIVAHLFINDSDEVDGSWGDFQFAALPSVGDGIGIYLNGKTRSFVVTSVNHAPFSVRNEKERGSRRDGPSVDVIVSPLDS